MLSRPSRKRVAAWIAFLALTCSAQEQQTQLENLLRDASAFSQQADYSHAIPLLRQAIELAPLNARANYLLGTALLQSGHVADAVIPLRVAARADPVNEAAEGYLGDAEMELKEFALAAEAFQAAAAHSPYSEQVLTWWTDYSLERYRALEFELRGSVRGRASLLQVAAESETTDPHAREVQFRQAAEQDAVLRGIWGELGVAQARLGMEANAESSLKRAQQAEPRASSTLALEAVVDAAHGRWPEANAKLVELSQHSRAELEKLLTGWPSGLIPGPEVEGSVWQCLRNGEANCSSKVSAANRQGSAPAVQLYEEARWEQLTALPPPAATNAVEWFWRGMGFAKLGDCSRAIPALERGLKPGAEPAAARLMSCYEREAIHTADQLKAQGKEASVHQIRGDILLSIRLDPSKAVYEYSEALKLKPNDPQLMEKSAEAYFSLGEMTKAQQMAQEALKINPHREQLLRLLIRIAMSEREYASALGLLSRLAGMEPDDAWVRVQQATAYAQTGRPQEAVQCLQPALDGGYLDEKGSLHALLAAQLRKLGRDQDAKNAADEAVKLADSFEERTQSKPDNHP